MKLTDIQLNTLADLRQSDSPLGRDFATAWNDIGGTTSWHHRYERVMDIKSPLMDRVRALVVAETLIGELK